MNGDLTILLQNYGFSEKEAKLYLMILFLGEAQASTISRNVGEKRTTVYSILKEMVKKGYVSEVEKNGTFQYSAISPQILLGNMERKYFEFKELLPELLGIMNQNSNNIDIQYLYGDKGLGALFLDFANSDIEVKTFAGTWKYHDKILKEKSKYYIKKRTEKGLSYKRIISKHNVEIDNLKSMKEKDKLYGRETVIVDNMEDIHADIDIYGPGKVSLLYFKNDMPNIVIINNQLIYESMNTIFDIIRKQNYKN